MIPLVDLNENLMAIRPQIDAAIAEVLRRGDFILGEAVATFETSFAAHCEAGHAVGVDCGLSALELGMRALGIGSGDEVIVPTNSFIASASAVSFTGATPVFVDVDPETHLLDTQRLNQALTPRTKAVMAVHLYGQPADMDEILRFSNRNGIHVVEDACQAHGARYRGRRVGSFGAFAAFSFYPAKNLGALGDGGAIVTNDPELAATVRAMRNYGQQEKYQHVHLAWNRRLDSLQAAVLSVKLQQLDSWNRRRRELASLYDTLLPETVVPIRQLADRESVHHVYVVQTSEREALRRFLEARGVSTGIHYPVPIHLQPAYADLGHQPGSFPVAEALSGRIVSLPMYPELEAGAVARVAEAIRDFVDATTEKGHGPGGPTAPYGDLVEQTVTGMDAH